MVYLNSKGNKDVTIDQLIKILQRAKSDLGGNTKVLVSFDDGFGSLQMVSSDVVEGGYGYYEEVVWARNFDEDDDSETVLTLITSN